MCTVRSEPLTLSGLSHFQLDFEGDLFHLIGNSFDLTGRTESDVVSLSFHTPGEVDLGTGHWTVNHLEFPSLSFRGLLAGRAKLGRAPSAYLHSVLMAAGHPLPPGGVRKLHRPPTPAPCPSPDG